MVESQSGVDPETCHWHPENRAGVRCQRCERRICALCMHTASVGFHCPDCVAGSAARHQVRGRQSRKQGSGWRSVEQVRVGPVEGPPVTLVLVALNLAAFMATVLSLIHI